MLPYNAVQKNKRQRESTNKAPAPKRQRRSQSSGVVEVEQVDDIGPHLKESQTFLLAAKRNAGKSVLARYIVKTLLQRRMVDIVVCFSNTQQFNEDWKCLRKKNRVQGYDRTKLKKLVAFAQEEKRKWMADHSYKMKRILVVLDDIIGVDQGTVGCPILDCLLSLSRHIGMAVMIITQYVKKVISPTVRNNLDHCFLSTNAPSTLAIIGSEMTVFPGKTGDFCKFVDHHIHEPYTFLWYDNSWSNPVWRKIKAPLVNFHIGEREEEEDED